MLSKINTIGREYTHMFNSNTKLRTFMQSEASQANKSKLFFVNKRSVSPSNVGITNGDYSDGTRVMRLAMDRTERTASLDVGFNEFFAQSPHTVERSIRGTARHEYGHHVQNILKSPGWVKFVNSKPESFWRMNLSNYGTKDTFETFAESFSAFTSSQYKKGMLPKDVEKFMIDLVGTPRRRRRVTPSLTGVAKLTPRQRRFVKKKKKDFADVPADALELKAGFDEFLRSKKIGTPVRGLRRSLLTIRDNLMSGWRSSSSQGAANIMKTFTEKKHGIKTLYGQEFLNSDVDRIALFERSVNRAFELKANALGITVKEYKKQVSRLMDYMQANTSVVLKKLGNKKITLYRGVRLDYFVKRGIKEPLKLKGKLLETNSLSSWSTSKNIANDFGNFTMKIEVEVDDVFNAGVIDENLIQGEAEMLLRRNKKGYKLLDIGRGL
jgi:hypothetical protein